MAKVRRDPERVRGKHSAGFSAGGGRCLSGA
jgi:hypothetical protein